MSTNSSPVGADNIRPATPLPKRKNIRLKDYDYSQSGLYFITICAADKKCIFGHITGDKMILNNVGNIALQSLLNIRKHFPNATIHDNVIMPNHIHFILEIDNYKKTTIDDVRLVDMNMGECYPPLRHHIVSRNIASIVRGFKIGVYKQVGKSVFQRGYYDHIIKNDKALIEIQFYIATNPANWIKDGFYYS